MNTTTTKLILGGMLAGGLMFAAGCGGGSEGTSTNADKKPEMSSAAKRGRMAFSATCAICHGKDAKGMPGNGTDLTASKYFAGQTDEQLLAYVIEGRMEPEFGTVPMPPRGGMTEEVLPDDKIKDVIQYIRTINNPSP